MIKVEDVTIAISTYGERLYQALEIEKKFLKMGFKTLVIHQSIDKNFNVQNIDGSNLIQVDTIGVTKSRNLAIEKTKTKFIWFMDDDINILNENILYFLSKLPNSVEVISTRILNENGKYRKKYPKPGYLRKKRNILGIGTIELIANVNFLKLNKIFFPEFMGAGTKFPTGDEAVFVSKVIKNGGKVYHSDQAIIIHPDVSSGKGMDIRTVISKGLMIRLVFGYIKSFFICLYLSTRISKLSELGTINILYLLLCGVFSKDS
ncbi:hypothetical protein ACOX9X_10650 [Photobacterium leiognathi subsp. mandapamensis]|uniref:hypothetical protein n=1 Tax=Photobacterium leiognathi TaxID=553611 RepID=UPI003BF5DA1B